MLIDWFTVGAQVVNFLLLLYLLKRFLYRPILQIMDSRQEAIGKQIADAEKTRAAAEEVAAEYQGKMQQLEKKSQQLLKQAEEDAEQRRKILIDQARSETEELRQSWSEVVSRDQARFIGELKKRVGSEVLRIAHKSTTDLTGAALQPRLVAMLVTKLEALDPVEREKCVEAAKLKTPEVRTSFALGAELEEEVSEALQEICGAEAAVTFVTEPELSLGIEVIIGELKLSWGVDSYFGALEKNVAELFEEASGSSSDVVRGSDEED